MCISPHRVNIFLQVAMAESAWDWAPVGDMDMDLIRATTAFSLQIVFHLLMPVSLLTLLKVACGRLWIVTLRPGIVTLAPFPTR